MNTVENKYVARSRSSIEAICDFLCNSGSRMVTVGFIKKDGSHRTINGAIIPTASYLVGQGKFRFKENIVTRNSLGQCHTVKTQYRMVNLTTVSRLAFNKVVYNFI
jgi:hypothetical protein